MRNTLVATAVLAVCMTALGTPVAIAQQDEGSSEPTTTRMTDEVTPSEEAQPTEEPDAVTTEPQPSPIEVTLALNPDAAVPGQTVVATAACGAGGGAALTSPVLEPVVLTADPEGHQPWALRGTTTVRQDAQPGDYDVVADCDDDVSTVLTVLPAGKDDTDDSGDTDDNGDQVDRVPAGAPETGGGPEPDPLALLLVAAGLAGLAGTAGLAARRAARR